MTVVLNGKGLLLEGSNPQIEDKQIYTFIRLPTIYGLSTFMWVALLWFCFIYCVYYFRWGGEFHVYNHRTVAFYLHIIYIGFMKASNLLNRNLQDSMKVSPKTQLTRFWDSPNHPGEFPTKKSGQPRQVLHLRFKALDELAQGGVISCLNDATTFGMEILFKEKLVGGVSSVFMYL